MYKKSYKALCDIFLKLDKDKDILNCCYIDGWLAWSIVKQRLWGEAIKSLNTQQQKIKKIVFLKKIPKIILGIFEFIINIFNAKKYYQVIAYSPRTLSDKNGNKYHPFFGKLLLNDNLLFKIKYRWSQNFNKKIQPGNIHSEYVGSILAAFAYFFMQQKNNKKIALVLSKLIFKNLKEIDFDNIYKICKYELALFRVKYFFYKFIFKKISAKKMIVQDGDAKTGEIAAAKSLGILVIEVQHGMFGTSDIDYSWEESHACYRKHMPVADYLLVFGKIWKDLLNKKNFWSEKEIIIFNYPALIHSYNNPRVFKKKNFNILFPTQYYISGKSYKFWVEFLKLQVYHGENLIFLNIKIHPREKDKYPYYLKIEKLFPQHCRVLPMDSDGLYEMQKADIIIGYTSFMLLEAIGFGIPVINLLDEKDEEEFLEMFNINKSEHIIWNCSSPEELYRSFKKLSTENQYEILVKNSQSLSNKFFSNMEVNLEEILLEIN